MVVYGIFIAVVLVCVVVGALQYFQIVDIADWLPMLSVFASVRWLCSMDLISYY